MQRYHLVSGELLYVTAYSPKDRLYTRTFVTTINPDVYGVKKGKEKKWERRPEKTPMPDKRDKKIIEKKGEEKIQMKGYGDSTA